MNELKTLKDLIILCDSCKEDINRKCIHPCCRNHKRVRAEAVKWVKSNDWDDSFCKDWIKHFFNLTEEDLRRTDDE